jgi:hypothetical protein
LTSVRQSTSTAAASRVNSSITFDRLGAQSRTLASEPRIRRPGVFAARHIGAPTWGPDSGAAPMPATPSSGPPPPRAGRGATTSMSPRLRAGRRGPRAPHWERRRHTVEVVRGLPLCDGPSHEKDVPPGFLERPLFRSLHPMSWGCRRPLLLPLLEVAVRHVDVDDDRELAHDLFGLVPADHDEGLTWMVSPGSFRFRFRSEPEPCRWPVAGSRASESGARRVPRACRVGRAPVRPAVAGVTTAGRVLGPGLGRSGTSEHRSTA